MIRRDLVRAICAVAVLAISWPVGAAGPVVANPITTAICHLPSANCSPSAIRHLPSAISYHFDFTGNTGLAYQETIRLRLSQAGESLALEKKKDPYNLAPWFLENYSDFFLLFFNEDPAEYARLKPNLDLRLAKMKKGRADDPYTLFTRSILYFQWAAVQIKFGDRWSAAWSFRRAFLAGKENLERFPGFAPSIMLQGALEVAAGTIPPGYQWLSGFLGIKGTVAEGMKKLETMLKQTSPEARLFHDEAVFYYCYLRFYIMNDKPGVFQFIQTEKLDTRSNHLFAYLAANLSRNNHQANAAVNFIRNRDMAPGYADLPVWDMELGYALADHLDPAAVPALERFVGRFKGKFNLKESYQKLGWLHYLSGDLKKANAARERLKREGNQESEADKQAMKEAESGRWPQPLLLKARLLDDGGYFTESLTLLQTGSAASFSDPADQLEYTYRTARLYDALNRKDEALIAYRNTFDRGYQRKEHYAARAALQTGYIFEQRADKKQAIEWFRKVLEMKNHEYKNSLDQKARAGLARCGVEEDN